MEITLQLEDLACLKSVIRQVGLILSAKQKMDQFKNLFGQQMELFALELVVTAALFLEKLLISKSLITTGKQI